jgi:hypothetical protein
MEQGHIIHKEPVVSDISPLKYAMAGSRFAMQPHPVIRITYKATAE